MQKPRYRTVVYVDAFNFYYGQVRGTRWRWPDPAALFRRVPQPTISKIVNGNIEKLSIEFLIKLMVRAGLPVGLAAGRRRAARSTSGRRAAHHSTATA